MTPTTHTVYFDTLESPIGELTLTSDGVFLIDVRPGSRRPAEGVRDPESLAEAVAQLRAYFAGELTTFDLPIRQPGTPFQQRVWSELTTISYGQTISYAELAERIQKPGAARAVGTANGRNNLGVVVPCHRVIAADGTLGGYGWGVRIKQWLLTHEQNHS